MMITAVVQASIVLALVSLGLLGVGALGLMSKHIKEMKEDK